MTGFFLNAEGTVGHFNGATPGNSMDDGEVTHTEGALFLADTLENTPK